MTNAEPLSHRNQIVLNYEKRTDIPMSVLALVYLVTYTLQALFYDPDAGWYEFATIFGNVLWFLFAVDLAFRFFMASPRKGFFRRNWLDTITVVIPQLRALRALRAFNSNGVLARKGRGVLTGQAVVTAGITTAVIVWVGSLLVLSAERNAPGAEIVTFTDAIWWSFETVTTVGYGDFVPVTALGRTVAVAIMVTGISVLGVVSAGLAATLVKQVPPAPASASGPDVLTELADLKRMVASLEAKLDAASVATGTSGPTPAS